MRPVVLAILIAVMGCRSFATPVSTATATRGSSFRVVAWNVSDSAWLKNPESTRLVLRHADPDIFLLVQVPRAMTAADVHNVLTGIRGRGDTTWFVALHDESGVEHAVVASRDSLKPLREFEDISYPKGPALLRASPPDTNTASLKRDAVRSVHANAAMVRVGGRWVLAAALHLTCCGEAGSWREYRRYLGALVIRDSIRAALSQGLATAVVLGGDMNLVTGAAPLDTLLTTLDGSSLGPMKRAEAVRPDGVTDWTWDGRGTEFPNGRLDNVAYSQGTLAVARATVWDTEAMNADTLSAHGVTATTSRSINKHRPVVVEFTFKR